MREALFVRNTITGIDDPVKLLVILLKVILFKILMALILFFIHK